MTKEYKLIFLIFLILLVFGILVVFVFDIDCLFKSIFSLPCPGCGLTRGFRQLFKGNVALALEYNILTIFIFIFLVLVLILFIIDFIKKEDYLIRCFSFLKQYYILIIIFILVSWIVNLIRWYK